MADPDFPAELGNIPYSKILGAPLNAAVEANADASRTAVNFIQEVGFEEVDDFGSFGTTRKPVYVEFHYKKQVTDESGDVTEKEFEMQIPLLLLLHVPYFEVSNVTIDFNVKLHSVEMVQTETEGGFGGAFVGLPMFTVGGSYQKTEKRQQKVERTYDQSVHIEAGSIESPEGVTRLLDVLEQTITEEPGDDGSD